MLKMLFEVAGYHFVLEVLSMLLHFYKLHIIVNFHFKIQSNELLNGRSLQKEHHSRPSLWT